jgi:membrane glycosyltransferase
MSTDAARACRPYLEQLPLPPEHRRALLDLAESALDAPGAMAKIHQAVGGAAGVGDHAALASVRRRAELAAGVREEAVVGLREGPAALPTAPKVSRTPMGPARWTRGLGEVSGATLRRAALLRRTTFIVLALAQSAAFAYYMLGTILPYHGREPLELAILSLSTILFAWVSLGFWTALSGFVLLCVGGDRHAITRSVDPATPIAPDARTAVIMPIRNEDVAQVFAGLRATYESVAATGTLDRFDFFMLSDSNDPDAVSAERQAWLDLCVAVGGFGRVFYRWRQHRIKRKSGNVADFCRRWGSQYRYMVVLDADSVMSGECLATLARLMEANPTTGIIQTAPRAAGRDTLYARIQQFATRVYGPLFTAGLHFWQLGESYYWGHNAIIRIEPFMQHCGLGRLPGRGPFSGEILSHDFVEAALMRRAGWKVWMAYDLPGSYEEMPPNLVDELKRDRRWCLGNLINARLFFWQGLHPAHRAVFMTGIMSYVSAPLWLLSLLLSTAFVVLETLVGPQYFVEPRQLFPIWPEWQIESAIGFVAGTAFVLFLPKFLGAALVIARGARGFGGAAGVLASVLLELFFSALLAPVRMLFHSQFVAAALLGLHINWKSPPREDAETTWGEATRRHYVHTALGVVWAVAIYLLNPSYSWWLLPVVGALALSIPVSVYSSRVSVGRALRRVRLFLIPEEATPPAELRGAREYGDTAPPVPRFTDAVVDPLVNAIACAAANPHARRSRAAQARRERAVAAAVARGPAALSDPLRLFFLADPIALSQLHFQVWTAADAHSSWGTAPAHRGDDEAPLRWAS